MQTFCAYYKWGDFMYKVTLRDRSLSDNEYEPMYLFCDNIINFSNSFVRLESKSALKNFIRALDGEDVYDDGCDEPIIQKVDLKILDTKYIQYGVKEFTLRSGVRENYIGLYAGSSEFEILYACHNNTNMLLGSYKLCGVASINYMGYSRQYIYGNRLIDVKRSELPIQGYYQDKNLFKDESFKSICFLPIRLFDTSEEMLNYNITQQDLVYLMRDILGYKKLIKT